jgi:hypothetical protein
MLRLAPLLGIGALAVHQLRYAIGSGGTSAAGHGYLGAAGALAAGVMVVGLAAVLMRMARGDAGAPAPRLARMWAGTSLALVAVFVVQELAEGASPIAHGGWIAAPLAAVVALAIALLTRGTPVVVRRPWRPPTAAPRALLLAASASRAGTPAPTLLNARGPPPASA